MPITTRATNPEIQRHAANAEQFLHHGQVAIQEVEPGDMTRYLMVIAPVRDEMRRAVGASHVLSLPNFGRSYPVTLPSYIAPDYAADKWGGGNVHSGEIIAEYLNEISALWRERTDKAGA